jgi:phenylalanyl-tRNA synthetase alpha chain
MSSLGLHPIEKKIMIFLSKKQTEPACLDEIVKGTKLSIDQVRRGIERMKFKNLITMINETSTYITSNVKKDNLQIKLPERIIVEHISRTGKDSIEIKHLADGLSLEHADFNAGLATAIKNGWILPKGEFIILSTSAKENSPQENLLQRLAVEKKIKTSDLDADELDAYLALKKRPGFLISQNETIIKVNLSESGRTATSTMSDANSQIEASKLTSNLLQSGRWKHIKFSGLDVSANVQSHSFGRIHPLNDLIREIKEIFISMGFSEIDGPLIQSSFWNFDVLFTPQDHPAREMQDTFYLTNSIPAEQLNTDIVRKVSRFHKKGWKYKWKMSNAVKDVLRTHTTPITLRYLSDSTPAEARIFSVGRVFRNEKMTFKHLLEFHQIEGVVTGKSLSLRDLMGLQKLFYSKLGITKVKLWPTFFPYTEPSLQSMAYVNDKGKWIELFGMGIFRPEVVRSIGIKGTTLAWGGGLERIAMIRYGLTDVRQLYENRLSWLRSVPVCQL